MKISFYIVFGLLILPLSIMAQQAVPASGGSAETSFGSFSYTLGQIDYGSASGTKGSMSQGVQHTYEIWVTSVMENYESIDLVFSVYPNPTIDFLDLQIENYNHSQLSYQLFDQNGKIIRAQNIDYVVTRISMASLATATYFIRVIENEIPIKTFKIIKQ